jgi:hypothetical protein
MPVLKDQELAQFFTNKSKEWQDKEERPLRGVRMPSKDRGKAVFQSYRETRSISGSTKRYEKTFQDICPHKLRTKTWWHRGCGGGDASHLTNFSNDGEHCLKPPQRPLRASLTSSVSILMGGGTPGESQGVLIPRI